MTFNTTLKSARRQNSTWRRQNHKSSICKYAHRLVDHGTRDCENDISVIFLIFNVARNRNLTNGHHTKTGSAQYDASIYSRVHM